MKTLKLILCASVLTSFSAFAQIVEVGDINGAFLQEITAHDNSPVIRDFIAEVEAKYAVTCEGFTSPIYPYMLPRLNYKANCKGKTHKLKLKINSSYVTGKDGLEFTIRKYSLKIKK